jgi:NDP-sugar pyrophosphorylase family protein
MALNIKKFKKNLTVIILCGGKGERLKPLTLDTPKPLMKIKDKTILEYIINHLLKFNIKNIIIAGGYKNHLVKKFIDSKYKKNIDIVNTGVKADILERIKKIVDNKKGEFLVCYGDTLADININRLIKFYLSNKENIIASSYELKSSFGILNTYKNSNTVFEFKEKPKLDVWFNIGYIIFSQKYIEMLSKFKKFETFLHFCAKKKLMKTYRHLGKHITVNTISELEEARSKIDKFT